MKNGLHYVYTGNVHDLGGSSTYCPQCKKLVMGRDWYLLSDWHVSDDGHCRYCGFQIPGVFKGPPGTWGPRRRPVNLREFAAAAV